jgi:hypothetical protein
MDGSQNPPGAEERPATPEEREQVKKGSAPAGAAAGAVAGMAAGLSTGALGVVAVPVGAVLGALAGGVGGWFAGEAAADTMYTADDDAHYRALYESTPDRPADRGYDTARPAYQLGHLAAYNPNYQGRDFDVIEPELQRAWGGDLTTHHGDWTFARRFARDAYGHARSAGAGVRRDRSVIGPAGSAVDPVELDRARAGLPSVEAGMTGGAIVYDHSGYADVNNPNVSPAAATTTNVGPTDRGASGGLGEGGELDANTAHRRDTELH